MAITETARLERETEEARAELEQTLGELRARMSPGQLLDQASDYFRNSNGRAYLANLRDEVVHNPVPIALVGAGIAWLAISSAMGRRRGNGNGRAHIARDWGDTAAVTDDLAHGDRRAGAMQRARQRAEGWAEDARDTMSDVRGGASEMGERASTAYDETIERAREIAEDWRRDARATTEEAGETLREGVHSVRERASDVYEEARGGMRRVARRAAHYGHVARHAVERDGPLVNFCREQPMLVAGLGLAVGAALAAMIPASRTERQVMGEASRNAQHRMRDIAKEGEHSVVASSEDRGQPERRWAGPGTTGAAADLEHGMEQASRSPNVENEPQTAAPYAEAAEAGTAEQNVAAPGEEIKPQS